MNCEDVYVKTSFLVQGSHMWSNLIEVGTEISAHLKLGFKSAAKQAQPFFSTHTTHIRWTVVLKNS